jgi:glycosyltransferase involved in cell wall biosynthesis
LGTANVAIESNAGNPAQRAEGPIRLALCVTELEPGGAERCVVEIATRLDPSQFAPVVYSLAERPAAGRAGLVERLEAKSIPTVFLGARRGLDAPRTLARLVRLLRRQRPQVTQTFLHHANLLGAAAARLAGMGPTLSGIRVAERSKPWRAEALGWIDPWVATHVCVSSGVAEFVAGVGGVDPAKICVIPNGIAIPAGLDLERGPAESGTPAIPGLPIGRRWIVSVARLDRQKGVDRLLIQAPAILGSLPDHDIVIAGCGGQWGPLRSLAGQSGFADRIHFLGWRADARDLLAAADVIVSLSRWEGMSNVLLEAMAFAKPVVATAVEGIAELLGRDESPQIVVPGRLAEAPAKVVTIARNEFLRKELGASNFRRVASRFAIEIMVERYASLFRQHARER